MKKCFLIVFLLCFCFIFAGCSGNPEVGLVNNSDGTIIEYYYIPFPEEEMQKLLPSGEGSKLITVKNKIKEECDKIFQNYINLYQSAIELSENFSLEEKTELIKGVTYKSNLSEGNDVIYFLIDHIRYTLNFDNSKCYSVFKNINTEIQEEKQTVTEKTLFTTTTKVIKDPIFNKIASESITLGQQCINVANSLMAEGLGDKNWESLKEKLPGYSNGIKQFNYVYIVPTARLHSNADEIIQDGNYYYHVWKINTNTLNENSNSIIKIEYWTISANRVTWYILAIGISIIVITIIYFVGKSKEKNNLDKSQNNSNLD